MSDLCESAKRSKVCIDDLCRSARGGGETLCGFDPEFYAEITREDEDDFFYDDEAPHAK